MAWTVTYEGAWGGVAYRFEGPTTLRDIQAATSRGIQLAKRHGTDLYLVDGTDMEVSASAFEILRLPEEQYVEEGLNRASFIALLPPSTEKDRDAFRFYETACVNRGWTVQSFTLRDDAIAWLQGQRNDGSRSRLGP